MKLEGKVALVTGAAQGMGKSHCLALAKEGANIAAADICKDIAAIKYPMGTEAKLNATVAEVKALGRKAIGIKCDVSKSAEVQEMFKKVLAEFKKIDILVNNAGILTINPIVDMTEEDWDTVVDVDLKGTWLCCKYVLPHMIAQKSGKIINIGSIYGREGAGLATPYCAAKGGVHTLTMSIAKEVAPFNINVNAVGPGAIHTPMVDGVAPVFAKYLNVQPSEVYATLCKIYHIFGREVTVQDISNAVVFLASEDSRNLTGQVIYVDGGHLSG